VDIGNRNESNLNGKVTITGHVSNMESGAPVSGVTVFIKDLSIGAITNENGIYSLSLNRGFHQIRFSSIGFQEKLFNVNLYSSGEFNVELEQSLINLDEIIVSARKNLMLDRLEVGIEKINISSFKTLPTSMGETDIMKSMILLPGVQSVGEGSAGFNVRGGSADQNLILLHGAPVYNSSHFFGFFSAVNSDIIKDVTLYKGGIPSRFGGRISSVLEIDAKEGNTKKIAGSAGISPIATRFMIEGPLIKDTLSYLISARTTYSNYLLGMIDNPILHNKKASFYDLTGSLSYAPNKNNKLEAFLYNSQDKFRLNLNTNYSYNNNILSLKWIHKYNSRVNSSLSINYSDYNYEILNKTVPTEAYLLTHKIKSSEIKADFNWLPGSQKVNFGIDISKYSVMPGNFYPGSDSSFVLYKSIENEKAIEGALYVEDKISITDFLMISIGVRMASFFSIGPHTISKYSPDFSKTNSTIIGAINYKSGELIKSNIGPELRASINWKIANNYSLKMNYNKTRQNLHLLSNSSAISPSDTWKLSDYYVKPEVGDQYAIGFYKSFSKNIYETSVELYYKEIKNMIDYKGGSTLTMAENIEQYLINVKGKAYGFEFMFKKIDGKIRYNIGYTYARTFIKSIGRYRDEIINSGNWYPANYDRPNSINITYQYIYSRRFSFSADYTYTTGRPITLPIATYKVSEIYLINYSDRNRYRIPDYSRFDISCKINGNLRSNKIAHPSLTFSVYNLMGKENAYSVFFQKEKAIIKAYKLSVFGRPIPSVTFSFDF
jgi:hypothetical protein